MIHKFFLFFYIDGILTEVSVCYMRAWDPFGVTIDIRSNNNGVEVLFRSYSSQKLLAKDLSLNCSMYLAGYCTTNEVLFCQPSISLLFFNAWILCILWTVAFTDLLPVECYFIVLHAMALMLSWCHLLGLNLHQF